MIGMIWAINMLLKVMSILDGFKSAQTVNYEMYEKLHEWATSLAEISMSFAVANIALGFLLCYSLFKLINRPDKKKVRVGN